MSTLEIKDLHVSVANEDGTDKEILKGVNLTVNSGETHAVMGPNGSGKSTLSYAIAGHPKYHVTSGSITLDGEDVLTMSVDELDFSSDAGLDDYAPGVVAMQRAFKECRQRGKRMWP